MAQLTPSLPHDSTGRGAEEPSPRRAPRRPWAVASLRRYPVKSMGGEQLTEARLGPGGLDGDRTWAVTGDDGYLASGKNTSRFRRRDEVFDYRASTTGGGEVRIHLGERSWRAGDPDLDRRLSEHMGATVHLIGGDGEGGDAGERFHDEVPVSIVGTASLHWCEDRWGLDADPRRLRVNIVLDTTEPFVEESWVGHEIAIGSVVLRITQRIPRCRMIDIDQDGATADEGWLRPLGQVRDACLAVAAEVVVPGRISTGDRVVVDGVAAGR